MQGGCGGDNGRFVVRLNAKFSSDCGRGNNEQDELPVLLVLVRGVDERWEMVTDSCGGFAELETHPVVLDLRV